MTSLYREPGFTFRFAEDRSVGRFHLSDIPAGRFVRVIHLTSRELLTTATTEEGGWVTLPSPLIVRAGEGFIALPEA